MTAEAYLETLIRSGVKLGLSTASALREATGRPDQACPIIHVAGTNGKGSVCALLAGAFRGAGIRAGFFSSPHLVSVRERIRINCEALSPEQLEEVVDEIRRDAAEVLARDDGSSPTYFEFLSTAALVAFRRYEVEVGILEVGMGGRLDSTNVVTPAVAVITHIDLDHVGPLGDTHAKIAAEKAGIIKPGVPVICGVRNSEALAVIERIAAERGAPLLVIDRDFGVRERRASETGMTVSAWCGDRNWELEIQLRGRHQADNAAVAVAVLEQLRPTFGDAPLANGGMGAIAWPGRSQWLRTGALLDVAHNPSSVASMVCDLQERFPGRRWRILLGLAVDKDAEEIFRLLAPLAEELFLVAIPNPRAAKPKDLAMAAERAGIAVAIRTFDEVASGLEAMGDGDARLITGSLYLAGEVLRLVDGDRPAVMLARIG